MSIPTVRVQPGQERLVNVIGVDQLSVIGEQPRKKSGGETFVTFLFALMISLGGLGILLGLIIWGLREVWGRAL